MVQIEGTAKELLDEAEAKDDDVRPGKLDEAKGFLITELSEGERPATEIIEKARKNEIAKRTLALLWRINRLVTLIDEALRSHGSAGYGGLECGADGLVEAVR